MSVSLLDAEPVDVCCGGRKPWEGEIRDCLRTVVQSCQPASTSDERRQTTRQPYPYPIYLTPVADDSVTPIGDTIVVLGKFLAESGLDFYHREPLPYRKVIASLRYGDGLWAGLLLDLGWCRFSQHGWYDSGGRFLRVVHSPLADDTC